MGSDISGFYKLTIEERIRKLKEFASLGEDDIKALRNGLSLETADMMIENVIGMVRIPLGIAAYFMINGSDYFIPMAIEEPSIVAAASNAAKLCRRSGGFSASSDDPLMIGQIELKTKNMEKAKAIIKNNFKEIKNVTDRKDSVLIKLGGGLKAIEFIDVDKNTLDVHLVVDVRDAMGANCVNTMCESVAPLIEELTGSKALVKIISNLAVKRIARAEATWSKEELGEGTIDKIIDAYEFAVNDQYRCTTHNKGTMNGIDAVAIAVGNDFRALEAGAHSYAAFGRRYSSLTKYEKTPEGDLKGSIELPLAVGIVGGATMSNPTAKFCLKMLNVKSSRELAEIMACVGLANNFAALRAIVNEGIQRGHMKLHARNIAIAAGASRDQIEHVCSKLIDEDVITFANAKNIVDELNSNK